MCESLAETPDKCPSCGAEYFWDYCSDYWKGDVTEISYDPQDGREKGDEREVILTICKCGCCLGIYVLDSEFGGCLYTESTSE